jgi:hypothetical protein
MPRTSFFGGPFETPILVKGMLFYWGQLNVLNCFLVMRQSMWLLPKNKKKKIKLRGHP